MKYKELKQLLEYFEENHKDIDLEELEVVVDTNSAIDYDNLVGVYINDYNQVEFSSEYKGIGHKS